MKVSRSWKIGLTLTLVLSIVIMAVNAAISTTKTITPIFPQGFQIQDVPQQAIITPTFNAVLNLWVANVTGWKTLYIHIANQTACVGCNSVLFSNFQNSNYVVGVGCIDTYPAQIQGNNKCIGNAGDIIIASTQGEFIGINSNGNGPSSGIIVTIFATND